MSPVVTPAGGLFESLMDAETAAQRWADTWSRAWPQRDAEAIAALYGDTVISARPRSARRTWAWLAFAAISTSSSRPRRISSAGSASRSSRPPRRGRMVGQLDRARPGAHLRGSDGAALRRPGPGGRAPRLRQPRTARATLLGLVKRSAPVSGRAGRALRGRLACHDMAPTARGWQLRVVLTQDEQTRDQLWHLPVYWGYLSGKVASIRCSSMRILTSNKSGRPGRARSTDRSR